MRYEITVAYDFFGVACQDVWQAPNENAKECMVKSAKENGMTVVAVKEIK